MTRSKREDLERIPLGECSDKRQLKRQYKQIYGGVAWPGKRPGFVVVVGMGHEKHFENHDIYLLDEFESADTRELVRQCGVLDFKYEPQVWIGDRQHDAGDRFIHEMNDEFSKEINENFLSDRRLFSLLSTQILEMKQPFAYIFPQLKMLLDNKRRQLFLKDSQIISHLATIAPEDVPEVEFGDFPAIEAIGLVVIEMRRHAGWRENDSGGKTDMAESYTTKSVL